MNLSRVQKLKVAASANQLVFALPPRCRRPCWHWALSFTGAFSSMQVILSSTRSSHLELKRNSIQGDVSAIGNSFAVLTLMPTGFSSFGTLRLTGRATADGGSGGQCSAASKVTGRTFAQIHGDLLFCHHLSPQ